MKARKIWPLAILLKSPSHLSVTIFHAPVNESAPDYGVPSFGGAVGARGTNHIQQVPGLFATDRSRGRGDCALLAIQVLKPNGPHVGVIVNRHINISYLWLSHINIALYY
jgi:hypothetical protein